LQKKDAQAIGLAITYLRRYAVMAMCGVAAEDDDGNSASNHDGMDQREARRPARKEPEPVEMYSAERSGQARAIMLSELPDCVNRGLLAAWFARHDAEGALMTVEDCNIVAAAYNAKRAEFEAADGGKQ